MNRIKGKRILITGASAGIGQALARQCAAEGAHLVLAARRLERLEALRSELEAAHGVRVDIFPLDVRRRQEVEKLAARLHSDGLFPDILVNNAGLAQGLAKIHEGDPDDWDTMIDTNLKGLLYVTRAILPGMVARGSGHVVHLGSIAGRQAYPGGNVYNATKFALRGLTEAMNLDLLGTPVRMSSVSPGLVQTEFAEVRFHGDRERARAAYANCTPLTPEDIAEAVLFVINAPPHVNVLDLIVLPTDQRGVHHLHRTSP